LESLITLEIKKGFFLFHEGDSGSFFYILKDGKLKLHVEATGEDIFFTSGDVFGELALIQNNKRTGTVVCVEDASLFCLDGTKFRDIIQRVNKKFLKDRTYFLTLIPIFRKKD